MKLIDDIKGKYANGDTLTRLVLINCAVFALSLAVDIFLTLFFKNAISAAELFQYQWNAGHLLSRPWTIITSPFTSWGIWHLLFNMICLYWFGGIFMQRGTSNTLRGLYILGALAAMVCYSLLGAISGLHDKGWPESMPLASASILAICTAMAFQTPDREEKVPLLGYVKIKWLVAALGLVDIAMLPHLNPASDLAHAGAAAMGWYFQYMLRKGTDITLPLSKLYASIAEWLEKRRKQRN